MAWENVRKTSTADGWLSLSDGNNQIRIVEEPVELISHYDEAEKKNYTCVLSNCPYCAKGIKKTVKYLTTVIDRADGKAKYFRMPRKVLNDLINASMVPDYAFEKAPSWDVIITQDSKTKSPNDYYKTLPGKETPLTEENKEDIRELTRPATLVQNFINKELEALNRSESLDSLASTAEGVFSGEPDSKQTKLDDPEKINSEDIPF